MRSAVVFTLLTVRWAGSELHIFSLFLSRLLALCWRGSWWGGPCRSLRSLRASASSPFPLLLSFFSVFIPRPLCAPLFFSSLSLIAASAARLSAALHGCVCQCTQEGGVLFPPLPPPPPPPPSLRELEREKERASGPLQPAHTHAVPFLSLFKWPRKGPSHVTQPPANSKSTAICNSPAYPNTFSFSPLIVVYQQQQSCTSRDQFNHFFAWLFVSWAPASINFRIDTFLPTFHLFCLFKTK